MCVTGLQVSAGFNTMGVGKPRTASEDELRRIDLTLPSAFAASVRGAGVRHFSSLTAVGADASATPGRSTAAGGGLYNMLKGQLEENISKLEFESAATFRPATLLGTPNTPGPVTWLAPKLDFLLPSKYKSSDVRILAAAMVSNAEAELSRPPAAPQSAEIQIFEGDALHRLYAEILA